MLTGISGSKQVLSTDQTACSETACGAAESVTVAACGVRPMASASLPSMRNKPPMLWTV